MIDFKYIHVPTYVVDQERDVDRKGDPEPTEQQDKSDEKVESILRQDQLQKAFYDLFHFFVP